MDTDFAAFHILYECCLIYVAVGWDHRNITYLKFPLGHNCIVFVHNCSSISICYTLVYEYKTAFSQLYTYRCDSMSGYHISIK